MLDRLDRRILGPGGRLVSVLTVVLAVVLAVNLPAAAQSGDLFSIRGIEIDTTGENDLAAKRQGVAEAKQRAFNQILERLTARKDMSGLPEVSGDRLEFLIRDVTFESEKFGGGRYLAELTVRFQRDAVEDLLRREGIAYAETSSRPIVVLPVYVPSAGAAPVLWSSANPWLTAWIDQPSPRGLVPITVPLGDLDDIGTIDSQAAISGDSEALAAMAELYDAGGVAVSVARPSPDGSAVEVSTTVHADSWAPFSTVATYQAPAESPSGEAGDEESADPAEDTDTQTDGDPGPTLEEAMYSAAVEGAIADMEDAWTRDNLLRFDQGSTELSVRVPLAGLADFVAVRRRLEDAAPVRGVTLERMTVAEAEITLAYIGDIYQLQTALSRAGLTLDLDESGTRWQIRRAATQ